MKLALWVAGGSILMAAVLSVVFRLAGLRYECEIWTGMAGPALAAIASLIAMQRQATSAPQGLTRLLMLAFVAKFLFFAVYVTILFKCGWVQLQPFALCFAGFYIALHGIEAIWLRRMQSVAK